eukprot:3673868-Pyramimonas_sp.AAC.1
MPGVLKHVWSTVWNTVWSTVWSMSGALSGALSEACLEQCLEHVYVHTRGSHRTAGGLLMREKWPEGGGRRGTKARKSKP